MAGRSSSALPQGERRRFPTMPLPVRVLETALPGGGNVILSAGGKGEPLSIYMKRDLEQEAYRMTPGFLTKYPQLSDRNDCLA